MFRRGCEDDRKKCCGRFSILRIFAGRFAVEEVGGELLISGRFFFAVGDELVGGCQPPPRREQLPGNLLLRRDVRVVLLEAEQGRGRLSAFEALRRAVELFIYSMVTDRTVSASEK